jgi:HTH-type transcriptional regulator/antitoxin HigA
MSEIDIKAMENQWPSFAPLLVVPHTEDDYLRLVEQLDALIDVVGEDENHPLASLMEVIGVLIEKYEDEHVEELGVA